MKEEDKLNEALVYGTKAKIQKVFEEIYNKYYKLIYFCIRQRINNKMDIEELTNDTFVSFYNSLFRDSKIISIKNYLCQIAENKTTDYLRKRNTNVTEYNDNVYYENNEQIDNDIFSFLQSKCNEDEYYILIHHIIYNETFKEIAKDKNASINTVKSSYRRIIKKLKGEYYEKN
ncbi:MAG: RNA polymerase sigma factor [Bacilli bacterium]